MKAISYALFGLGHRYENCFDFNSYLRSMMINVRLNRLIYPDWVMIVHINKQVYDEYKFLFDELAKSDKFEFKLCETDDLCKMMLWRMKPIFEIYMGKWKYSHVICRDLDSPTTYREAQAVQQWINNDKAAHAITDSISHTIPMLGGMIGFRPDYLSARTGWQSWKDMFEGKSYDFSVKGSDQDFLCREVYPKVAQMGSDSITQHYVLGHANTFLSDFHREIPEGDNEDLKFTNQLCGHIGASGYYSTPMDLFLKTTIEKFDDLVKIEENYKEIFYWIPK